MKKAINIAIFPDTTPLDEVFSSVKTAGFQAVELNMHGEKKTSPDLYPDVSDSEILEVKKLLEKYSLECVGVVTDRLWTFQLTSDDDSLRGEGKRLIRKMIDICGVLGADSVLVVPGVVNETVTYKNAYANALESMKELSVYAEEKKVNLGVENVWNKFLLAPYEMSGFIDSVGSDYVGAYFDVGNVVINSYPEYWIEILEKRIKRIHVKGFNSESGAFCMLWDGTINWPKVMSALKDVGYDGYITAELWADGDIKTALEKISGDITKILES